MLTRNGWRKSVAIASALALLPLIAAYLVAVSWTAALLLGKLPQNYPLGLAMLAAGISLTAFFRAWHTYHFTTLARLPRWVLGSLALGIVQSAVWTYLMRWDPLWMAIVGLPGLIALDLFNRWFIRSRQQ